MSVGLVTQPIWASLWFGVGGTVQAPGFTDTVVVGRHLRMGGGYRSRFKFVLPSSPCAQGYHRVEWRLSCPIGEANDNPLQYSCLENPMDRGACRLQFMGSQRVGHDWATLLTYLVLWYLLTLKEIFSLSLRVLPLSTSPLVTWVGECTWTCTDLGHLAPVCFSCFRRFHSSLC